MAIQTLYNVDINSAEPAKPNGKEYLNLSRQDWLTPLGFLLSMAMMGLRFPLGYLLVFACLITSFKKDKYDFLIQLTMLFGGYGFTNDVLPFKPEDLALMLSVVLLLVYRKDTTIAKTLFAFLIYAFVLLLMATYSEEKMSIQLRTMRNYWCFIYFIVPLAIFANRDFDIKLLFRKLIAYCLVICAFYFIDGYIIKGNVLVPTTYLWGGAKSTFYSIYAHPFTFQSHRKYPPGLYLLALCIVPVCRYYKLTKWQWIMILLAFAASKTFTVLSAFIFCYAIFQEKLSKNLRYFVSLFVALSLLYAIDSSIPVVNDPENPQSALRIASSIDQITALGQAQDDTDFSEFGSGRMAQALPKFELLESMDRVMIGFGFLHPELTTMSKYILHNEFYSDQSQGDEVVTGVEVTPLQTILSAGVIGFVAQILFYLYTCYVIRKKKLAVYYYATLTACFWFGLGGFSGLIAFPTLALCGFAFGVVLLHNKRCED